MEYVINVRDVKPIIPEGHTRTLNRMLINDKCGINSFTLHYGEVLPGGGAEPHSHPYEQACYILGGKAKLLIGGKDYILEEGMVYFAPAGVEHQVEVIDGEPLRALVIYEKRRSI
jgi:quercetin dioxygenase-like cupin family protein